MSRRVKGGGNVYRRKDSRWEGAAYLPTTSGASRRIRIYGKTSKEVSSKLILKLADAERGIPVSERSWTVGSYLDYWMTNVAPKRLRPSTIELYESLIRRHIKPVLASQSLTGLTVVALQKIMDDQILSGMSVSTGIQVQTILMAALTNAMREDLVIRNVARLVKLGNPDRKQSHPWTAEELKQFLAFTRDERLYPAFLIPAIYGMRLGEVMGLRWSDVDWGHNVLHVRQQLLVRLIHNPHLAQHSRRSALVLIVDRGPYE